MHKKREAGFTLLEFAISTLTGMVVLAVIFTLMNSLFVTNAGMTDMMATQANVRAAINIIARDITMAGTGLPSGSVEVPNGDDSVPIIRPGMADFSSPDRDIETPNDALPFLSPGNEDGPTVSTGSDALTIFSVDQETPTWTIAAGGVAIFSDRYEVTFTDPVNTGAMQLAPGDLLLINNSNGSVLLCVTAVSNSPATLAIFGETDVMGVNQPAAEGGNLGSLSNDDPPTSDYPPTTAVRINLINYFISTDSGRPRLMRAVNDPSFDSAQVIAEDVENLQFAFDLFDYDTEAVTANQETTSSPNQIRSVLVAITGRSTELMARTNDYYRFQLVSKINVRNATFRNRYGGT